MWIALSLIYSITNAYYIAFNQKGNFDGYVLGIWRGFGISLIISPLLLTIELPKSGVYYLILILQGLMIGIYDSRIFYASAKYGANTAQGFMATTVLITAFLWWGIDISELRALFKTPAKLISLMLIFAGISISYWSLMRVHVNKIAETCLYPAAFALAVMSIATRFIAIHGGSAYAGVVCYLTISCLTSGIYNAIMFIISPKDTCMKRNINYSVLPQKKAALLAAPIKNGAGFGLIILSTILIAAKTLAFRIASNPAFVMSLLLLSPLFADIIKTRRIKLTPPAVLVILFQTLLLLLVA